MKKDSVCNVVFDFAIKNFKGSAINILKNKKKWCYNEILKYDQCHGGGILFNKDIEIIIRNLMEYQDLKTKLTEAKQQQISPVADLIASFNPGLFIFF